MDDRGCAIGFPHVADLDGRHSLSSQSRSNGLFFVGPHQGLVGRAKTQACAYGHCPASFHMHHCIPAVEIKDPHGFGRLNRLKSFY
jgi:hypothetical protein